MPHIFPKTLEAAEAAADAARAAVLDADAEVKRVKISGSLLTNIAQRTLKCGAYLSFLIARGSLMNVFIANNDRRRHLAALERALSDRTQPEAAMASGDVARALAPPVHETPVEPTSAGKRKRKPQTPVKQKKARTKEEMELTNRMADIELAKKRLEEVMNRTGMTTESTSLLNGDVADEVRRREVVNAKRRATFQAKRTKCESSCEAPEAKRTMREASPEPLREPSPESSPPPMPQRTHSEAVRVTGAAWRAAAAAIAAFQKAEDSGSTSTGSASISSSSSFSSSDKSDSSSSCTDSSTAFPRESDLAPSSPVHDADYTPVPSTPRTPDHKAERV
jgi:hypothetical protein